MTDNAKLRLAHLRKQDKYGVCKPLKTNRRYKRLFNIPSPVVNGKPLLMDVDYYSANDKTVIDITGSWRKWYLGRGTTRDLTFEETKKCIKQIAIMTGLSVKKILNAKIENIELGFTIRFKENMGGIVNAFVYYKGFDTIYEYSRQSVKFKADAYSVAFYDKYSELMNKAAKKQKEAEEELYRRTGVRADKQKSKKLLAKKLNENNFALRFEVKIKKPSGCPPEFIRKVCKERKLLIATPSDILANWDEVLNGLDTIFCRTTFSKYNLNAGLKFLKDKGLKELSLYESHITASVVGGVNNYVQLLMKELKGNHRDTNIKKKINILNSPPPELRKALKSCRNKKEEVLNAKDRRIIKLRKMSK